MRNIIWIVMLASLAITTGCESEEQKIRVIKPTFMPFCYRDEIVQSVFIVPEMSTPAAAKYIDLKLRGVHGYVKAVANIPNRTLTISYTSSSARIMNFEEAIAMAGFKVNTRPAYPNVKLPAGIK